MTEYTLPINAMVVSPCSTVMGSSGRTIGLGNLSTAIFDVAINGSNQAACR